jgi:phosphoglycolate phosphatase-like HAD superfamily hydrolase
VWQAGGTVLLVLWDIDGTLVHSAGHGRFAFQEAFEAVVGREPEPVEFAGRTDHQIALAMLGGERDHLPRVLEELAGALEARKEAMRSDVGDTPLDMRAAQEAGARAVVVATGFADRDALHASRPDAFLEDRADTAAAVAAITGST